VRSKVPDELRAIEEKVLAGDRLSAADGMRLYETTDLNAVGYLANIVRERMCGISTTPMCAISSANSVHST
jgi:2-iminoacetate synthase ThiH